MNMIIQSLRNILLAALALVLVLPAASAASMTWSAPATIAADTDVSTIGTLVYACTGAGTPITVNSVAFAAGFAPAVTISGVLTSTPNSYGGGASAPWSNLSANYQTALQGGIYTGTNATLTVTLKCLTPGHNYSVQLWVNDSRSGATAGRTENVSSAGGNSVTLAYNNTQAQGGVGQYTIGTFTADALIQSFVLDGVLPAGNDSSQINAIQVRDTTPGIGILPGIGIINWLAATNIAGDADVSTNGNLVYAYAGSGTAATVNTVPFAGGFSGNVTVSGSAGSLPNIFAGGTSAPWSGLSTNYQAVLQGGTYANNNASLTVTLNNLTPGRTYAVQLWANDSRSGNTTNRTEIATNAAGNSVTLAYNHTQAQGGLGQFTTGLFIADAVNQTFMLTGVLPSGNNAAQINAIQVRDVTPALAQLPAFPGAEGYGALASGGRGGTVYHVTNLADSGPGSFRDAISQPNRTIVFDVGGTIVLQSRCYGIGNLTIAGQTAPVQGICIYSNSVYFQNTNNVIIRHVRFRQGVNAGPTSWSLALMTLNNAIVDHCSIELGDWQTLAVQGWSQNVTVQNCIVGAGLNNQMGALIWNSPNVTVHHTLWIDDGARDPKIDDQNGQIINDVVYNPSLGIYGSSSLPQLDLIGNYHIAGPNSPGNPGLFIGPSRGNGYVYFTNNLVDTDNNGVLNGSQLTTNGNFNPIVSATAFCFPPVSVTMDSPTLAYYKVGSQAGCSLARDSVDNQLVSHLLSLGTQGQYYTNEAQLGSMTLPNSSGSTDTDQDGMPDEWELATGSNYQVADNNVVATNGYTLLENYLNWMAAPHTKTYKNLTAPDYDLYPLTMAFTNQSPTYTLFNPTNGTITLVSNRWARFAPATNFTGLGSFTFTVKATDSTIMTNSVGVLITPLSPPTNLVWRGDAAANVWNLYLTNDWFNGTALQPFNGDDNVIFDDSGSNSLPVNIVGQLSPNSLLVNSTKNYTFGGNGSLVGNFTLTKTNSGTLILAGTNSFSGGLFINGGTVVVTNSPSAGGSGTVYLNGGTLNEASASFANPISCSGTNTWIISGGVNAAPSSTLTGSGRLLLSPIASGQFTPAGDWNGFSGTIFFTGVNPQMRIYGGSSGSAGATFDLGTNTGKLFNRNGSLTVQLGALAGGTGTLLTGASAYANPTTNIIGGNNLDSVFNGQITDGTGVSMIIKVGTGTLTLTGMNTYSGSTTISNGILQVNGSLPTNTVTVAGGTLAGIGVINGSVSVLTGGTISPGTNNATSGTLTVSNNLTLAAGSFSSFGLGTNSDRVMVKGNLALGGTLNVTNFGGLAAGTNTLFIYTGALSGSLAMGVMPPGFKYLLATNVPGQVNLLAFKPVITTTAMVSTNLVFTGSGGIASSNYYVLTSSNIALPLTSWTRLNTNIFDSTGRFAFTNAVVATNRNRFYLLQMP